MKTLAARAAATTAAPAPRQAAAQPDHRSGTVAQRQQLAAIASSPRQQAAALAAPRPNRTGLPDQLKAGVESLSGHSLDEVRVHYNSDKPAQLQAHAYAQGAHIHLGPGQEKYLPHEAWHVAQQKQGRVQATTQLKGVAVNEDAGLEKEADVMGRRAGSLFGKKVISPVSIEPGIIPGRALAKPPVLLASQNGIAQLGKTKPKSKRKSKRRAAKIQTAATRMNPLRGNVAIKHVRIKARNINELRRTGVKKAAVDKAAKKAFQRELKKGVEAFKGYPEGSYGHGRFLYLSGKLKNLGAKPGQLRDLQDYSSAAVEVDHSPHDGSQRGGKPRKDDDASRYRVAVPLPRSWHRRHKTTHGVGATVDPDFVQNQNNLVESGNYGEALHQHLLNTFSKEVVSNTGADKITAVASHTIKALEYANSNNIKEKIHGRHSPGKEAITLGKRKEILLSLHAQLGKLDISDFKLNSPFNEAYQKLLP